MTTIDLLPDPDTSVRCSAFAREISLDPGGTAFAVDEIIVADTPLPWPKPVFAHPVLAAVPSQVERAAGHGRRIRVLAAVPDGDDGGRVVVHRRARPGSPRLDRTEHRVGPTDVAALLGVLLTDGADSSPGTEADVEDPVAELLVCTQGSHDLCCGSRGTRFALDLAQTRPDVALTRVSHTGGHRFAPTCVSLPDGRMWGMLSIEKMTSILDRSARPAVVAGHCRGWTGAGQGPAQVAERAVFALLDEWSFDDRPRLVEAVDETDGVHRVLVGDGDRWWEVDVGVRREVPTIACGAPGGLPAKPGREYEVHEIREVHPPRVER